MFTPAKLVLDLASPEGCKAELIGWLTTELLYAPEDGHPSIQPVAVTNQPGTLGHIKAGVSLPCLTQN